MNIVLAMPDLFTARLDPVEGAGGVSTGALHVLLRK